ncbi:MAG: thioredoxin family protein [Methylotenera sp.]|nr:thioredoxin family protein [Oligoflexia bacterium]
MTEILTGLIEPRQLEAFSWFEKHLEDVQFDLDSVEIALIAREIPKVSIVVYLGTWCGDTHEQVPPFLKLLELLPEAPLELRLFALDRAKTYPGFTNTQHVDKIPTFIFLKGGFEVGRIVESPMQTWVHDLHDIFSEKHSH